MASKDAAYEDYTSKITEAHIERMSSELSHGADPKKCKWKVYKTKEGATRAGLFREGQDSDKQAGMVVQQFVSPPVDLGFMALDAAGVHRFNPDIKEAKQKFIVPVEELDAKYDTYKQWYQALDKLLNKDRFAFLLKDGKEFLHPSLHKSSVAQLEEAAMSSFDKRLYYCKVNAPSNKLVATNWTRTRAGGNNLAKVSVATEEAIKAWSPGDPHGYIEFFTNSESSLDFRPIKVTLPSGGTNQVEPGDFVKLRHSAIGAYQLNVFGIHFSANRDQSSTVTSRVSDIWLLSNGPSREASATVSNFLDSFEPAPSPQKRKREAE